MITFCKKIVHRVYILLRLPKGLGHFLLDTLAYILRLTYVPGMPVNATIELTNLCDLKCPICETGSGLLKREKGNLKFKDYKIIIDKIAPFTNTVLLYYMGEPFLNKDIYDIIFYTKSKKIFVKICTNGQNIDAQSVINSGLDEIQFQLGGVTPQTQAIYRINSNLSEILQNVKKLAEIKKDKIKRGEAVATRIYLGLILMKHNGHELADFYDLARKLGVDGARVEAPCIRTIEQGKLFLPKDKNYWLYDIKSFNKGILRHKNYKPNHCRWMYYSITITCKGDVIPCCRDIEGTHKMGNLLEENIATIWNGKKFINFRKKILGCSVSVPMCFLCDGLSFPSLERI